MVCKKTYKLNISLLAIMMCFAFPAGAAVQTAWDNPNANMAAGSSQPGYANLTWSTGTVLPIKTRADMATLITLPAGESIAEIIEGAQGLFLIKAVQGQQHFYVQPDPTNNGSDTNLIVLGKSGNKYIFYLRPYPVNSGEITYSQVDISAANGSVASVTNTSSATGSMGSVFTKKSATTSTVGVDGEDYGWIKTMKIDPSEFRFDLDIFVPNPDDYVIAPERVWRDRIFTYIDFGDKVISMTQRPVVSLLVEGGESPVGFRTDGEDGRLLIVEAVGDMILRSGQRIVCIKKREKPFLIADTASVMALAEANVAQSLAANQSLNNIAYADEQYAINAGYNDYTATPMMVYNQPNMMSGVQMTSMAASGGASGGVNMVPTARTTAGAYLPQTNIPLITSNQTGVAIELKSDTSVKALNDYWTDLLAKFSGDDGVGLLTPYKNSVFFAVDEHGVGDLGTDSSSARLYRLRIGPLSDIETAQKLCDQLLKFSGSGCHVVRIQ